MRRQAKKNIQATLENKFLHALLFLVSGLLLFLPVVLKLNFENLTSLGILGVALFNFVSSATLFFPAPGIVATGIGGSLYNPILVALASSIGSSAGEAVGYTFGHASRKLSHPMRHGVLESLYKILHHKHGTLIIVAFAFIPNPFFDFIGIVAGLALLPLKRFLLLVFVGRFARDLIVASVASFAL